jgi:beta-glucanase (GH16 family)
MAAQKQWSLSFDDEFNSLSASPVNGAATWETKYWWGRAYSDGQEFYLDPTVGNLGRTPYTVDNGVLTITARPTDSALKAAGVTQPFTTGHLDTYNTFAQQYGYFEMRAETTDTPGTVSTFWLLPKSGDWPPEVDIAEVLGRQPDRLFMTSHTKVTGAHTTLQTVARTPDLSASFHTYGLEWNAQDMIWYLDGKEVGRQPTQADQNQPMYIIASLGVGSTAWHGTADPATFPATMNIDYIRAYTQDATTGTASGGAYAPLMGKNTIVVRASEDAYNGDARFQLLVDGQAVGAVETVRGLHGAGQWNDYVFHTDLPTAGRTLSVQFLNDSFSKPGADRNLYVASVTVDGQEIAKGEKAMTYSGKLNYTLPGAPPPPPQGKDTVVVRASEDAFNGDARFQLLADGKAVGPETDVTALHARNVWGDYSLQVDLPTGTRTLSVQFTNDSYGGVGLDRNLYVDGLTVNGRTIDSSERAMTYAGKLNYTLPDNIVLPATVASSGLALGAGVLA